MSQVESEKDSSIKRSALLRWAKPKVMIEQVKWSSKSDLELDPKPCKPILSVSDIFNGTTTSWCCRFLLHQDNHWEYPRTVRINHIESTHYLLFLLKNSYSLYNWNILAGSLLDRSFDADMIENRRLQFLPRRLGRIVRCWTSFDLWTHFSFSWRRNCGSRWRQEIYLQSVHNQQDVLQMHTRCPNSPPDSPS